MSDEAKRSLDVRRGLQEIMDGHAALQDRAEQLEKALEVSRARVTQLDKDMEESTAQGIKDLETIEELRRALLEAEQQAVSCAETAEIVEVRRRLSEAETALESLGPQIEEFERISVSVQIELDGLRQRNVALEAELTESRRQLVLDRRAVFAEASEQLRVNLQEYMRQLQACSVVEREQPPVPAQVEPVLLSNMDIEKIRQAIDERKVRGGALQESIDQMNARLAEVVEQKRQQEFDKKPITSDVQATRIRDWIDRATDARRQVREEMVSLQGFVIAWERVHGPKPVIQELPAMPVFSEDDVQEDPPLNEDGQDACQPSVVSKAGLIEALAPKLGLSIEMTTVLALFAVIQKHSNPPHMSLERLLREAVQAELITLRITLAAFIERVKKDKAYTQYFEDIGVGRERRNPSVRLSQLLRQSLEDGNLPVFFGDEEIERLVRIRTDTR